MAVLTIPAGHRSPLVLADFLKLRRCRTCGQLTESYFEPSTMRAYRLATWGDRSLRRMARELKIPPSSLRDMESGNMDFTEDLARAYLTALGII